MLKRLEIQNYAIIDYITLEFGHGLTIITGETGAGKSIIVDALGLLLGERLSSGMLRKDTRHGYVEGEFEITHPEAAADPEHEENKTINKMIIRREFSESGAGRCFVNGKTSTVQNLKKAFDGLIDMHGQHQHQSLLYADNYYDVIDRFGNYKKLSAQVASSHNTLIELRKQKNIHERTAARLKEMRDYLEFQLKEINRVNPQTGEYEELEREWKVLQNAEKIRILARDCNKYLYDDEQSALTQILKAQRALEDLRDYNSEIEALNKDLATASVSVEEAAKFLQRFGASIESNPARLEEINQRLMSLKQLQKKYKTDIAGILKKKARIEDDLQGEEDLSGKIQRVSDETETERNRFSELCIKLSKKREKTAGRLQRKILERLKRLGMGKSLFDIVISKRETRGASGGGFVVKADKNEYAGDTNGIDEIQFLIATGRAERFLPISQIASGGELSRIMLAIKAVLMQADHIPTLIFDEIDAGISGRIAAAVGNELHNLAEYHQILCITHLPQIAGKADHHFSVEKIEQNGRIVTHVTVLDEEGRKQAIAGLIAGEKVTDSHLKSAEELLQRER